MSILISDLKTVPGIIGALGLGIADAQKEMNADYLRSVGVLVDLVKALVPKTGLDAESEKARLDAMRDLLLQLAPPRYQYTHTELHVKMDLAQTTDRAARVGGSIALGAIAVNGSFAMSQTQQYSAAAECHTVLDATPPGVGETFFKDLFASAKTLPATPLPEAVTAHDKETLELAKSVGDKIGLEAKT